MIKFTQKYNKILFIAAAAFFMNVAYACAIEPAWTNYTADDSELLDNSIKFIKESPDSIVWAGTMEGINFFEDGSWHVYDKFQSSAAFSIAFDTSNVKWFGLSDRIANSRGESYELIEGQTFNINSIAIDRDGYKWIATSDQGIIRFKKGEDIGHWDKTVPEIPQDNNIYCIAVGPDNVIWAGTDDGVIEIPDPEDTGTWEKYDYDNSDLPINRVQSLFFDSSDRLWLGTPQGLSRNDEGTGEGMNDLTNYTLDDEVIFSRVIRSISQSRDGNIWVGTSEGAVEYDGNTWTKYNIRSSDIISNNITDIAAGSDGSLWFATTGGVSRFLKKEIKVDRDDVKIQGGQYGYVNPDVGDVAKIRFNSLESGKVKARIYNSLGMLVRELSGDTVGGDDYIIWDCRNISGSTVSSGVYTIYFQAPGIQSIKRVPVVR
ncbi:MAG: two-component regulator propeller domain-containing protein [Elusimicrobiota bacterium]